ncbi:MAG TPA: hypothetical protein EYO66_08155, partial [Gammaproteobacteria bacterium]|nr:hypothetical protein [Gammaproteobacteria bacterium]
MTGTSDMSELHNRTAVLLARGFGAGCSPVAPGTVGTAVAVPLVCLQLVWSVEVFLIFLLCLPPTPLLNLPSLKTT